MRNRQGSTRMNVHWDSGVDDRDKRNEKNVFNVRQGRDTRLASRKEARESKAQRDQHGDSAQLCRHEEKDEDGTRRRL